VGSVCLTNFRGFSQKEKQREKTGRTASTDSKGGGKKGGEGKRRKRDKDDEVRALMPAAIAPSCCEQAVEGAGEWRHEEMMIAGAGGVCVHIVHILS
jgi:hypothetical protein